ncbi:hypothetical protein ACU61A_37355 [Pseudonocardia sichuanensis]|uniref:hypothetical protein n=1 Tax=Pseudonocardia kunmingensis TaxID=630975 RepID=UPI001FE5D4A9|nr:hypothetical protein [Pseudonocardia kunmingensis]
MATKIGAAALAAILLIPLLIAAALGSMITSLFGPSGPSTAALADMPPDYLNLYRAASGTCPGLDWTVLAAVGKVETDHGRSPLPGVRDGENASGAGVISGSAQAPSNVRNAVDTPRAGEVSAGCES